QLRRARSCHQREMTSRLRDRWLELSDELHNLMEERSRIEDIFVRLDQLLDRADRVELSLNKCDAESQQLVSELDSVDVNRKISLTQLDRIETEMTHVLDSI